MKKNTKQTKARAKARPVKIDRAGFPSRLLEMIVLAVAVALIVEGFNQGTVPRMLRYLTQRPLYFGINCLVILAFLSISELFKRRRAMN